LEFRTRSGKVIEYQSVLVAPVLSEKTNKLREVGKYVFKVDSRATKIDIKEACRVVFNVHPLSCRIINVSRKPKKQRYRSGYTSAWKKAIIKLPENEKIPLFEGV
jgi:large subunit ribosomal protein L23